MDLPKAHTGEFGRSLRVCGPHGDAVSDGLHLASLELRDFRNYSSFRLDGLGPLTILTGPNAVGKTSAIEAIQMVTALKSFRTSQFAQMQRWGTETSSVDARIAGGGRKLDLRLTISEGKRSYLLNGKNKRIQDLKGLLPAVSFNPDDLNLAKGGNTVRRSALDGLGSQLSKNFYAVKNDYAKLVRQKNRALKDELPDSYVDSIDEVLVRVGTQLMAHRLYVLDRMQPMFKGFYDDMSARRESVEALYVPSWDAERAETLMAEGSDVRPVSLESGGFDRTEASERFFEALGAGRMRERSRMKAVVGPQSDKIVFLLNGRNAMHYSSQGQQRSIVLAFKLAESSLIEATLDQKPILLLDDVLSELDEMRRRYFLDFISEDIQTFITTTNAESISSDLMGRAAVVRLNEGRTD